MVFRAPGNGQLNMPAGYSCGPCGLPVLVALQAGQKTLATPNVGCPPTVDSGHLRGSWRRSVVVNQDFQGRYFEQPPHDRRWPTKSQ